MGDYDQNLHAKILRSGQYIIESQKYVVNAPRVFRKTKEQEIDESSKRIEDLREEIRALEKELAEKFDKSQKESDEILEKAEQEAERIVKESEKSAFERVKKSLEEKEQSIQEYQQRANNIIDQANIEAGRIIQEARTESEKIKELSRAEAFQAGKDEGFQNGKMEIVSMTERLRSIIKVMLEEREKILVHSENQIMNLVIAMVKKIVKKLTAEEQNVVINNTKEALSIVRGAMKVYIHVNPEDYNYTTKHKDELIKLIEGMPEVKIFEDPTIDRGGVFIETDVGEIDAKIANQLEEIEDKIRFFMPITVKGKGLEKTDKTDAQDELNQAEVMKM